MTDDGYDLAYDSSEGVLQIVLVQYRKLIIRNSSWGSLVSVGVAKHSEAVTPRTSKPRRSDSSQVVDMSEITPGMEFIDDNYVMQIQNIFPHELLAMTVYKIVDNNTTMTATRKVNSSEIVIYIDISDVHQKIQ